MRALYQVWRTHFGPKKFQVLRPISSRRVATLVDPVDGLLDSLAVLLVRRDCVGCRLDFVVVGRVGKAL